MPDAGPDAGHTPRARLRSWAIVLGIAALCAVLVSQTAEGAGTGDAVGLAVLLVIALVLTVSIVGAWWSDGFPAWRWEDPPGWSPQRERQLLGRDREREKLYDDSRVVTAGGRSFRAQVPLVLLVDSAWFFCALVVYDASSSALWLLSVAGLGLGLVLCVTTCAFGWPFVLLLPDERRPPGWRALRKADRLERAARPRR